MVEVGNTERLLQIGELKAENAKLRAALEQILQTHMGWTWEDIASRHWDIASRALEEK